MKAKMRFSLKAGERIFINGAVLTVSHKVTLCLLNEARFLLESYVLQMSEATTPMRQLYFIVQSFLINPQEAEKSMDTFRQFHETLIMLNTDENVKATLRSIGDLVAAGRTFEALKVLRTLFEPQDKPASSQKDALVVQAA